MTKRWWSVLILFIISAGCGETPLPTPPAPPTVDPYFAARGTGEPRGAGYWLLWNGCAPDNRAETAATNGGREAGWIIMDDLLAEPGILLGDRPVAICEEGVRLLQASTGTNGEDEQVLPALARQLLVAQLNLAVGAEHCPAVDEAVQRAQLLLLAAGYEGPDSTLRDDAPPEVGEQARLRAKELAEYNAGTLCR